MLFCCNSPDWFHRPSCAKWTPPGKEKLRSGACRTASHAKCPGRRRGGINAAGRAVGAFVPCECWCHYDAETLDAALDAVPDATGADIRKRVAAYQKTRGA